MISVEICLAGTEIAIDQDRRRRLVVAFDRATWKLRGTELSESAKRCNEAYRQPETPGN